MDVTKHQPKPENQKVKTTEEKKGKKGKQDKANQLSIDEQIDQLADIILDILLKEQT